MENQVIELDELAVEGATRDRVGEVSPCSPTVADDASPQPLVEAGDGVLGRRQREGEASPGEGVEAEGKRSHHVG